MSTKGKPQHQQVRHTQELRRSNASGPHSLNKYERGSKYPVDYNKNELDIDEYFFWEDPLNNLEEDLDIPGETC